MRIVLRCDVMKWEAVQDYSIEYASSFFIFITNQYHLHQQHDISQYLSFILTEYLIVSFIYFER